MNAGDIIARAMSVVGTGAYELGKGGRKPNSLSPLDKDGLLDCSGFVAWAMGLDRKQPEPVGWLSTDGLITNAKFGRLLWFVHDPQPGDVVVYGDATLDGRKRQGHTGVVVGVGPWGWWHKLRVIHCSMGNMRRFTHAIAETDGELFGERESVFVRRIQ